MSFIDTLIGKIAPHDCLGCGAEGGLLCSGCTQKLPSVPRPPARTESLERIKAVTPYRGAARDLIWQLKASGAQAAANIMAAQMAELIKQSQALQQRLTVIVPVPTATTRVRQRGYDQAKLLARPLARQSRLSYLDCLGRQGQTHQVGAGRQQRLQQLGHSFYVRRHRLIKDAHVILVDDVVTTGATLEAAAVALRAAGAQTVEAITFAQA